MSHCTLAPRPAPPAYSENVVWQPYLQQLTGNGVIILWTTHSGANPTVQYGSSRDDLSTIARGSSRQLAGVQLHRVQLSGLQPNTTYYYKIYTAGEDLFPREPRRFQTAPPTGSAYPFTFLVFGDYGQNIDSQKRLRDQMRRDSFDFILTTGDNAYQDGTYSQFHTNVFQIYQDIFSEAGLFPTLGNHDYLAADGAPYLDIFELPENAWRSDDVERYYSFDYGNVHFVALDSNSPLDVEDRAASDDMLDWLRYDLEQTAQPWKIVALHHAPHSTDARHGSDARSLSKLVPILEAYDVDIVFSGHAHTYQRSNPMLGGRQTTVKEGGIVYVVSGAGAAANYECDQAEWLVIAYCDERFSLYVRVIVDDDRLLVTAIDEQGETRDSFILTKRAVASFPKHRR